MIIVSCGIMKSFQFEMESNISMNLKRNMSTIKRDCSTLFMLGCALINRDLTNKTGHSESVLYN